MTEASNTPEQAAETTESIASRVHLPEGFGAVRIEEVILRFKTDKVGYKRPDITLGVPVPTADYLVQILNDGNTAEIDYVLALMKDSIVSFARDQVSSKDNFTQEDLDLEKLKFHYIATLPPSERRGSGISKEVWEAFGEHYMKVMPALNGKTEEAVANAVKIYMQKFQQHKTQKKLLGYLKEQLALYMQSAGWEEFSEPVEFLTNKIDTLMLIDEDAALLNL